MTSAQLSAAFFLQMFVILVACRLVGALSRRLGQPQVVGEMIAGVFLGPYAMGLVVPLPSVESLGELGAAPVNSAAVQFDVPETVTAPW